MVFRHQAREAEPVDYDISTNEVRKLSKSTYKRIGNVTDGKTIGETTYQNLGEQVCLLFALFCNSIIVSFKTLCDITVNYL